MPSLREPPRSSKPWCGQAQRLVAGRTQAGKTTLLNCLAAAIPGGERVVSVEEVFELRFPHPDWVPMQTRQSGLEGTGEITLRDLVKESLRMRPSRLIVGEVRAEECMDLLLALNAGLPSACTISAAAGPSRSQHLWRGAVQGESWLVRARGALSRLAGVAGIGRWRHSRTAIRCSRLRVLPVRDDGDLQHTSRPPWRGSSEEGLPRIQCQERGSALHAGRTAD